MATARREAIRLLAQMVAPFAPHLAEECWARRRPKGLVATATWPDADPALLVSDTVLLPVQVNGKKRGEITLPRDATQDAVEQAARADDAGEALPGGPDRAKGDCRAGPHREYRGVMIRIPAFVGILALALLPLVGMRLLACLWLGPGASRTPARSGIREIGADQRSGATGGRTGHFLRQELVRTVGQGVPGVTGAAHLEVTLQPEHRTPRLRAGPGRVAFRLCRHGDLDAARRQTERCSHSGGVSERASFNFADAAYADLAAQTAAQERLATLLARSIREQMLVEAGKPRARRGDAARAAVRPSPPRPASGQ